MSSAAVVKAKRFVINRIVDQAKRDNVPLSEVEIAMLGFAKTSSSLKELQGAAVFAREFDDAKYESKIAKLVHDVRELDKKIGRDAVWEQSLVSLSDDEIYLAEILRKTSMPEPPGPRNLPGWRAMRQHIPAIALVAAGIVVIFTPWGETLVPNSILRAVVGLCCWVAPFLVNKLADKQAD
jgi:hypothetical protein